VGLIWENPQARVGSMEDEHVKPQTDPRIYVYISKSLWVYTICYKSDDLQVPSINYSPWTITIMHSTVSSLKTKELATKAYMYVLGLSHMFI
jgi:hypothetical protein